MKRFLVFVLTIACLAMAQNCFAWSAGTNITGMTISPQYVVEGYDGGTSQTPRFTVTLIVDGTADIGVGGGTIIVGNTPFEDRLTIEASAAQLGIDIDANNKCLAGTYVISAYLYDTNHRKSEPISFTVYVMKLSIAETTVTSNYNGATYSHAFVTLDKTPVVPLSSISSSGSEGIHVVLVLDIENPTPLTDFYSFIESTIVGESNSVCGFKGTKNPFPGNYDGTGTISISKDGITQSDSVTVEVRQI